MTEEVCLPRNVMIGVIEHLQKALDDALKDYLMHYSMKGKYPGVPLEQKIARCMDRAYKLYDSLQQVNDVVQVLGAEIMSALRYAVHQMRH